ncbi:VPLPA-CTERM sorting domain-containing protein [bacterium]|nr:VPLPA-CTERM sorting domain-containing protein [bacterium]
MVSKMMKSVACAALIWVGLVTGAGAATVTCTGTLRSFTLDTTPPSTCAAVAYKGDGNINGNADLLMSRLPGLVFLDTFAAPGSEDDGGKPKSLFLTLTSGMNGLAGTFSFDISKYVPPAGLQFYDFVIAFKSGGNFKKQSVWAAFSLPEGVTSGGWKISGQNGLSHANLYAFTRPLPPAVPPAVPLPAAGWMLLSGLAGLVGVRTRRKV